MSAMLDPLLAQHEHERRLQEAQALLEVGELDAAGAAYAALLTQPFAAVAARIGLALVAWGGWEGVRRLWAKLPAFKNPFRSSGNTEPTVPTPEEDRHTVLAIQGRLKGKGNATAAATAYKLLGEMLEAK